jgi:excisionase family DNA binding protein
MNKSEAAKFLEIGVRSLERYTSDGRLRATKQRGKTGMVLDYAPDELARFQAELQAETEAAQSTPPIAASSGGTGGEPLAKVAAKGGAMVRHSDLAELAATLAKVGKSSAAEASHKLLLSLEECQTLTGLSRATLRSAIEDGALQARVIGRGWKVKRSELEEYVGKL